MFRTDASPAQGLGDLYGSLAIAGALAQRGIRSRFLVKDHREARDALARTPFPYTTIPVGASVSKELKASLAAGTDLVVVNRLRSPPGYVRDLRASGAPVVTVDDDGEEARWASLRINPLYPVARSLTSFKYLMLRPEFRERRASRRTIGAVRRVLVMQGGADTYGFLPTIASALRTMRTRVEVSIVTGPAFRHQTALARAVARSPRACIHHVPSNLPQLMREADMAISAGGLTMFELACLGTPSLIVCAERFEVATARRLEALGVVECLGFGGDLAGAQIAAAVERLSRSASRRRRMSAQGRRVIDGRGAERIAVRIDGLL